MTPRIGSSFIATATCCLACSGPGGSDTPLTATTGASEIECPATTLAQQELAAISGEPRWLQSYGELSIRDVASDAAGNVLVTHGAETRKLGGDGTPRWSRPFGALVAIGPNDDVFVAGELTGTLAVDTSTILQAAGARDVYVVRLDADGALEYAVTLSSSADDALTSLAVDATGNATVSGAGIGTVKLDTSGKAAWSRDYAGHVAFDRDGNLLLAGELTGTRDFGGGPVTSRGGADIVVVKLDANGQHVFSRTFGDAGLQQRAESIAVDAQGNALVGGVFDGSVDFGNGALTLTASSCSSDAWCNTFGFVAKLDAQGTSAWSVELGPMRTLAGAASDSLGNFVVTGALPGGVTPFRNSLALALDQSGLRLWRRAEWPETGIGAGHAIAIDPCNDVLWAVTARPDFQTNEHSYLAKLSP